MLYLTLYLSIGAIALSLIGIGLGVHNFKKK